MTQRSRGGFLKFGGDGGIRTLDLSDANRTLYQLSYAPMWKPLGLFYTKSRDLSRGK